MAPAAMSSFDTSMSARLFLLVQVLARVVAVLHIKRHVSWVQCVVTQHVLYLLRDLLIINTNI